MVCLQSTGTIESGSHLETRVHYVAPRVEYDRNMNPARDCETRVIAQAARLLRQARRPVSFSGAGLSAESGIPTFRDRTSSGLWSKFDPLELATPEAFFGDPKLVTDWYRWRRQLVGAADPNPGHRALAAQAHMVHVTQNADDLLERAGARRIVHLHGTIRTNRCSDGCGHEEDVDLEDPPALERCPHCAALMRPAIV